MPFSETVEQWWLSNYEAIALSIEETVPPESLKRHLAANEKELHVSEEACIIGCWHALRDPECDSRNSIVASRNPLKKTLVFIDTILSSRGYVKYWA